MENDIKFLRIQNFKSIKDVTLHPRRVNLIIGEPNVGKSNLLEAMTLLGGITYEQTEKFMGSFIRYEEPRQLFYDNLVRNTIKVETDKEVAALVFMNTLNQFEYLFTNIEAYSALARNKILNATSAADEGIEFSVFRDVPREGISRELMAHLGISKFIHTAFSNNSTFNKLSSEPNLKGFKGFRFDKNGLRPFRYKGQSKVDEPPKSYTFQKNSLINNDSSSNDLNPGNGNNLIEVIQTFSKLRQEIAQMFAHYGQKLQLRMDERRLEIIKDQDGVIYSFPYSSVADTLQRIIFYLAAIESNDDAVLLFEEPEAHSFPVYVSKLGRRIVESRNNQFFIDTHSPYLITEILETMLTDDAQAGELAMFAAYYEDHQTKVHQLSDEEVRSIRNDGIDVFYNMKRFTTGAAHNA